MADLWAVVAARARKGHDSGDGIAAFAQDDFFALRDAAKELRKVRLGVLDRGFHAAECRGEWRGGQVFRWMLFFPPRLREHLRRG